jgi:renalase
MDIGVIGAGAASAAATHVLDGALPEAEITILEKSGGVCGRAATRRRDAVTYDYGANYVKDGDDRVVDLLTETLSTDGLVTVEGPIHVFDEDGTVSEGRENDHRKWTYRSGLTQVAKRLFAGTDAAVHRQTRVEQIKRDDGWRLVDDAGDTWGPFDALLCSPPAPQTATLLREADWSAPLRDSLVDAIAGVEYRTIWTAVLGYEESLSVPYYALVNPGKDHEVGWIAREECKPGHVPDGESVLVVQANHDWSVDHLDDPPAEIVDALADLTADVIGERWLADPAWSDHQRWRYAIPEEGVASGPVDSARDYGLYLLGDWVAGEGRLHAALRNGLDTGEQVVYDS